VKYSGKYGEQRYAAVMRIRIVLVPGPWETTRKLSAYYGVKLGKPTYPLKGDEVVIAIWYYDCDGRGIPRDGIYKLIRTYGKDAKTGLFDRRTLKHMQAGCCPPQLIEELIMTEGGELAERDAAAEEIELHKQGYFGS